jgi:origin recognition complex subunit 4
LFETPTKRANAALSIDSANKSTEIDFDGWDNSLKASEVDGGKEDRDVRDGGAWTERSTTSGREAAKEGDITPARNTREASRPEKSSRGDNGSQRRSSVRRLKGNEEVLAKDPLPNRTTGSPPERQMTSHPDMTGVKAPKSRMRVAMRASPSGVPAALPKTKKSGIFASTNLMAEELATRNEAKDNREAVVFNQHSSGREKRKPRRYSADVEDMAEQHRKKPVGILTPSKRDKNGARKSVAFEEDEQRVEDHICFKDVEERSQASRSGKRKSKARSTRTQVALETEPLGLKINGAAVAGEKGSEEEEEELLMGDLSFPDMMTALDPPPITTPVPTSLPESDEDSHLTAVKAKVLSRLTNSVLVPLTNLATEYAKVHSLLKATVAAGEGNSILILGARGSGKTALIETALADVGHEHAEDFHIVRLNGFQQTDDKIALREIWRQLGREMQVEEDETNQVSSYADTMASLLHLLSHPEELAEVLDPDAPATTTKSVIFILDEFDLFATHPRQTLLYNLFDIAQAKKAPIAVIGCSTRVDVAESLEKRVKSRFSHRWIHLSQPKSIQAFEAVIEAALCVEEAKDDIMDDAENSWRIAWNRYIKVRTLLWEHVTFTNWDKSTFLPSPPVQALLRQIFFTAKSIPAAFSSLYIPVASITSIDPPSQETSPFAPLTQPDSVLPLLPSLPPLHLYLLISAARLDAIHNVSVVNFNLVYHHYVELASRSRLQSSASGALAQGGVTKIWGKEIAKAAWEELGDWEILMPAALGKGKGDDAPKTKMWRVDVTLEEVAACVSGVGQGVSEVATRWCKEV